MTSLEVGLAWIEWTTGKENFPSVRSSAKPLFFEYWRGRRRAFGLARDGWIDGRDGMSMRPTSVY